MEKMESSSEYIQGKGYQPCKDVAGSTAIFPSPLELIARVTLGPEYNQEKEKKKRVQLQMADTVRFSSRSRATN